ncbi:hypothetical protein [[Phormidium] sp. ETS-05]|uniref:hypothetical protein n=1 Tax=[Phormidium] sp. ETS-05 TaxID=222819 RepID=UPI0018EEF030|nr:hypothetical protein [[Phormidium] sp. ETS-05]
MNNLDNAVPPMTNGNDVMDIWVLLETGFLRQFRFATEDLVKKPGLFLDSTKM